MIIPLVKMHSMVFVTNYIIEAIPVEFFYLAKIENDSIQNSIMNLFRHVIDIRRISTGLYD